MTTVMDHEALIAEHRANFERQLEARLAEIRRLARAVETSSSALGELRFAVHNLAGIAGCLGHPRLSAAASRLDERLAIEAPGELDRGSLMALADQLRPDAAAEPAFAAR